MMKHRLFPILLIVLAGIACYANTLSAPFVFDDLDGIVGSKAVQSLSLLKVFHQYPHRFLGYYTFSLNYALGGVSVVGYHIVNILIHILSALLVYALAALLLRTPALNPPAAGAADKRYAALLPLLAALLFTVHPIQTQAVTYVIQRLASLAALWYLLSLSAYVRARLTVNGNPVKWYALSLTAAFLGMFTKETAATLPLAVVLVEFFFFSPTLPALRTRAKSLAPYGLLLLMLPVSYLVIGSYKGTLLPGDVAAISRGDYLITQCNVVRTYLRLLVLPVAQNLDYDYPVYHSLFRAETFLSFLLVLGLVLTGLLLFRRDPLLSFGILFFFLALSVESTIFPIWDVCFEHRLYLPMAGFSMVVACLVLGILPRLKIFEGREKMLVLLVILGLAGLASGAILRNNVWRDDIALWKDVIKKSPEKARGYNNLGSAYRRKNENEVAMRYYEQALSLKPDFKEARFNLANVLKEKKELKRAAEEYTKILLTHPEDASARNCLGVVFDEMGMPGKAREQYRLAALTDKNSGYADYNLGNAYFKEGKTDEAIAAYERAEQRNPSDPLTHNNLGWAFQTAGRMGDAEREYRAALADDSNHADARFNLANILRDKGRLDSAELFYRKVLSRDSLYAKAWLNLGVTLNRTNRPQEALPCFLKTVSVDSNNADAWYNLGNLYLRAGQAASALPYYQKAVSVRPSHPGTRNNYGVALEQTGHFAEAKAQYEAALRLDPGFNDAKVNLAKLIRRKVLSSGPETSF
jgi:tetratricopeptide (TPR) repeat protein